MDVSANEIRKIRGITRLPATTNKACYVALSAAVLAASSFAAGRFSWIYAAINTLATNSVTKKLPLQILSRQSSGLAFDPLVASGND
jgi:hypothetical protein